MTFLFFTFLVVFLIICFLLCAVVLMQESKSTGLGASFGGEGGDSLFGTSTADVLKKVTAYLAAIFLVACLIFSLWTNAVTRAKSENKKATMEEVLR